MHARRHPRAAAKVEGDGGRARDGSAYLTADRVLRVTLAGAVVALLFFSMSITAEVFYVTDVLKAGDAAYGVLMASWTLGMVAGAVGLARRVPPAALAAGALAGVAVQGLGIAAAAASGVLWAAFAGFTLGGIAHGVKNVLLRTLIHERVPDALRGRAFARLQRRPQRRRAGRARRRRRPDRRDRRPARAAAVGCDPARDRRRGADHARLPLSDAPQERARIPGRLSHSAKSLTWSVTARMLPMSTGAASTTWNVQAPSTGIVTEAPAAPLSGIATGAPV